MISIDLYQSAAASEATLRSTGQYTVYTVVTGFEVPVKVRGCSEGLDYFI